MESTNQNLTHQSASGSQPSTFAPSSINGATGKPKDHRTTLSDLPREVIFRILRFNEDDDTHALTPHPHALNVIVRVDRQCHKVYNPILYSEDLLRKMPNAASRCMSFFTTSSHPLRERTLSHYLLAGGDINAQCIELEIPAHPDTKWVTPLCAAAAHGNSVAVNLLLSHGAEINTPSTATWTPLMYALYHRCDSVAHVLLDRGADAALKTQDDQTALHIHLSRVYLNDPELTLLRHLLTSEGVDINAQDSLGATPLHAIWGCYLRSPHEYPPSPSDFATELLNFGALPAIPDFRGETAAIWQEAWWEEKTSNLAGGGVQGNPMGREMRRREEEWGVLGSVAQAERREVMEREALESASRVEDPRERERLLAVARAAREAPRMWRNADGTRSTGWHVEGSLTRREHRGGAHPGGATQGGAAQGEATEDEVYTGRSASPQSDQGGN